MEIMVMMMEIMIIVMVMTIMVVHLMMMVMPPVLNFELPQLIEQGLPSTLPCSNTR